jgi:RimJ/RimL family protein N-acetyltransferase
MQGNYKTQRLLLRELMPDDTDFIFELLNTPGWIKFIGDRNIKTSDDAGNYIQRIINNPAISYRVVTLLHSETAIGIVTFIKRGYLHHHDIGFAFLPAHNKLGYAFEATKEILDDLLNSGEHATILATTIPDNSSSIQLLKKLGFSFSKEIKHENLVLDLYTINK